LFQKIKFLDNAIDCNVNLLYSGNPGDSANTVLADAARAQVDYATSTGQLVGDARGRVQQACR
jgi:hypothetical protein